MVTAISAPPKICGSTSMNLEARARYLFAVLLRLAIYLRTLKPVFGWKYYRLESANATHKPRPGFGLAAH